MMIVWILVNVVAPIVLWALKIVAKVTLFLLIKLLEAARDTLILLLTLIFIDTVKTLYKRV